MGLPPVPLLRSPVLKIISFVCRTHLDRIKEVGHRRFAKLPVAAAADARAECRESDHPSADFAGDLGAARRGADAVFARLHGAAAGKTGKGADAAEVPKNRVWSGISTGLGGVSKGTT